jgi:hypothetical protein
LVRNGAKSKLKLPSGLVAEMSPTHSVALGEAVRDRGLLCWRSFGRDERGVLEFGDHLVARAAEADDRIAQGRAAIHPGGRRTDPGLDLCDVEIAGGDPVLVRRGKRQDDLAVGPRGRHRQQRTVGHRRRNRIALLRLDGGRGRQQRGENRGSYHAVTP